jgi:hypothetical protein
MVELWHVRVPGEVKSLSWCATPPTVGGQPAERTGDAKGTAGGGTRSMVDAQMGAQWSGNVLLAGLHSGRFVVIVPATVPAVVSFPPTVPMSVPVSVPVSGGGEAEGGGECGGGGQGASVVEQTSAAGDEGSAVVGKGKGIGKGQERGQDTPWDKGNGAAVGAELPLPSVHRRSKRTTSHPPTTPDFAADRREREGAPVAAGGTGTDSGGGGGGGGALEGGASSWEHPTEGRGGGGGGGNGGRGHVHGSSFRGAQVFDGLSDQNLGGSIVEAEGVEDGIFVIGAHAVHEGGARGAGRAGRAGGAGGAGGGGERSESETKSVGGVGAKKGANYFVVAREGGHIAVHARPRFESSGSRVTGGGAGGHGAGLLGGGGGGGGAVERVPSPSPHAAVVWEKHLRNPLVSLQCCDVTGDGSEEILVCDWDGMT